MTQPYLWLRGSPQAAEELVKGQRPKWQANLAWSLALLLASCLLLGLGHDKAPMIHTSLYSHPLGVPSHIESGLASA